MHRWRCLSLRLCLQPPGMVRIGIEVIPRALLQMLYRRQHSLARLGADHSALVSSSLYLDSLVAAWKWWHQAGRGDCSVKCVEILCPAFQGFLSALW